MGEDRRQQLLQEARDAGEFQRYTNSFWYYCPLGLSASGLWVYDAFALRAYADELDRLNGSLQPVVPPREVDPDNLFE